MTSIISITSPIFLLILIGYGAVRSGLIPQNALFGMGRFVLYLALPALIFTKLSQMQISELIQPAFITVYALGSLLTLLIGLGAGLFIFRESLTLAGIKALGVSVSNSAFIGYPLLLQVFPDPPTEAFAMAILVENLLIIPVCLTLLEYAMMKEQPDGTLAFLPLIKRIATNPIIIAVTAGVIASAMQLQLPAVFASGFQILSGGSAAVALVVIGGSLVGTTIKGSKSSIIFIAAGKLIIHPLLVLFLLQLFPGIDHDLAKAAIIIAAVSMFSIFPIIGGIYHQDKLCASTLLITTCLSFFSLSIWLWLLNTYL
jgi:malonate transporter